MENYRKIEK